MLDICIYFEQQETALDGLSHFNISDLLYIFSTSGLDLRVLVLSSLFIFI